ncbi:MAG: hypothetical protein A3K09_03010 [Nitrospinae bacterium RIFCSPLOWO2_12_FULL_47_7]|nr:MAG: hypothetical protein A3K09_03010 [Nitrospinae bacterium RIFCSPLOWO2_12_FULL_47_7]
MFVAVNNKFVVVNNKLVLTLTIGESNERKVERKNRILDLHWNLCILSLVLLLVCGRLAVTDQNQPTTELYAGEH